MTHVGQPGGAEFIMLRLCDSVKNDCEIVHFRHGPLERIIQNHGLKSSCLEMPDSISNFKREDGLSSLLKVIPATLSMIGTVARKSRSFDMTVCMSQKAFIFCALAKPFVRKPIIWFMNDLISPDHFSKPLIFMMARVFSLFANKIVLNSEASLLAWKNAGGPLKKTVVIYPGSDVDAIEKQIENKQATEDYKNRFSPDGKPLIGVFGRITSWKGQDVFIKAISRLDDARAIIVGDVFLGSEDFDQSLRKLIYERNLTDRVIFTGHLNDVPVAMAACDVVVHCSTLAEPFGLVIVEAMLSGTPVVASEAGGAKEIIIQDKTGLLTPMGDDLALSQAINKYLKDPEYANNIAMKAKVRAKIEFSNDMMIKQFKDMLDAF